MFIVCSSSLIVTRKRGQGIGKRTAGNLTLLIGIYWTHWLKRRQQQLSFHIWIFPIIIAHIGRIDFFLFYLFYIHFLIIHLVEFHAANLLECLRFKHYMHYTVCWLCFKRICYVYSSNIPNVEWWAISLHSTINWSNNSLIYTSYWTVRHSGLGLLQNYKVTTGEIHSTFSRPKLLICYVFSQSDIQP